MKNLAKTKRLLGHFIATALLACSGRLEFTAVAAEPVQFRVLSYNIHYAEGTDGKLDLPRIAVVIKSAQPDLVALQEVDQNARRTGSVDQPAELARLTDLHVYFGDNIPLEGGHYGNAVLSRLPILKQQNHKLPSLDAGEQRGAIVVEVPLSEKPPVRLTDTGPKLRFLATHLDHRANDRERQASAEAINRLLSEFPNTPAILAGDLNDSPDSVPLAIFAKQWTSATQKTAPTFPADNPTRQIDYILFRPAKAWKVIEARVLDEPTASDHRPILATLQYDPG